jgi:hypothetical protein
MIYSIDSSRFRALLTCDAANEPDRDFEALPWSMEQKVALIQQQSREFPTHLFDHAGNVIGCEALPPPKAASEEVYDHPCLNLGLISYWEDFMAERGKHTVGFSNCRHFEAHLVSPGEAPDLEKWRQSVGGPSATGEKIMMVMKSPESRTEQFAVCLSQLDHTTSESVLQRLPPLLESAASLDMSQLSPRALYRFLWMSHRLNISHHLCAADGRLTRDLACTLVADAKLQFTLQLLQAHEISEAVKKEPSSDKASAPTQSHLLQQCVHALRLHPLARTVTIAGMVGSKTVEHLSVSRLPVCFSSFEHQKLSEPTYDVSWWKPAPINVLCVYSDLHPIGMMRYINKSGSLAEKMIGISPDATSEVSSKLIGWWREQLIGYEECVKAGELDLLALSGHPNNAPEFANTRNCPHLSRRLISLFSQGARRFADKGMHHNTAVAFHFLGELCETSVPPDYERAITAYTSSLEAVRRCDETSRVGTESTVLCNLGLAYRRAYKYDDALLCYRESQALCFSQQVAKNIELCLNARNDPLNDAYAFAPASYHVGLDGLGLGGLGFKSYSNCAYCGSSGTKLQKCSRCDTARYCSKQCQKLHWKHHKESCKPCPGAENERPPAESEH